MTTERLTQLHRAVEAIERNGIEALRTATDVAGEDVAVTALIMLMRIQMGSLTDFPPDPSIKRVIDEELSAHGIGPARITAS
ncbi:MAG: hypothetical protein ABL899_00290 [Nitrospira sp.]